MTTDPQANLFQWIKDEEERIDKRSVNAVKRLENQVSLLRVLMVAMLTELSPSARERCRGLVRDVVEQASASHDRNGEN